MGAFSHLTRRKFIKSAAVGAGAMAASQYVPDELMADTHKKILPPDGRFKNIELTYKEKRKRSITLSDSDIRTMALVTLVELKSVIK